MKHECPENVDEFFAQLFRAITYKLEPPHGYKECVICGGLVELTEREKERERCATSSG